MSRLAILLALFGALGLLPLLVASPFWLAFAISVLYAALLGQAWNLLGGYGGQFSFGHAAFFGTGAYAIAILQMRYGINPWLALPLAGLAAAAVGGIVGLAAFRFRLRGSYFALVTLAVAEVLRILANAVPITGAGVGLLIPLDQRPENFQFASRAGYYWVIWALCLGAFLIAWGVGHSRFGARLTAVRDNEDAARALGVDPFAVKMQAILLSAGLTGLAGAFYVQQYLYLDPAIAYGPAVSVEALLVAIVGGMGTLFGPLLGGLALHALAEVAREVIGDLPGVAPALYGVLLVVMVWVLPHGLAGVGLPLLRRRPAGEGRANG